MKALIRHIKFELSFDFSKLQNDLQKILNNSWVQHYNKNDYDGSWTSIALLSANGKSDAIYAFDQTERELLPTEILAQCSYFTNVIDSLLFKKTTVRLLKLSAGAVIKPHQDHCLGYEDGCFRMHIPIVTNPLVEFILDNERLHMNAGECWYIDANFTHSVANKGTQDRIHLVIDGIRNNWTDALFFAHATAEEFIKPEPVMSQTQKLQVIEELKKLNTPAANAIITQWQSEL
ncbi:aspartyl/asparaginyl beta-hydroxylase domain-containing protein [Flavobacterium sp. FPG59]|uniref:aspartyl/asparaginyl beta-hydroxylase domain-containing protein n=1 Tax=Flavobacterium sp. FPG59 TaxID=1929267 RepID=UPI000A39B66C|nr:aspartyl/asparaginyl beta-hydroxylase domain-containing protein [Flavobacterium sp. FPG59]OUD32645.1 aspartyl beta-hydroxylase [Flavobacterium sp. FPG59]